MNSLTLRLNLLLIAGLGLLLVLQLAGMLWLPRTLVEDYVVSRLQHDADTLYARLLIEPELPERIEPSLGTVYDTPLSGHYFRIDGGARVIRSRSLWDVDLPLPAAPAPLPYRQEGPAGQRLLVYAQFYTVHGQRLTIRVAEDVAAMEQTVAGLQRGLLGVSLLTLLLVLGVQLLILRRALRPLHDAVEVCRNLERGQTSPVEGRAPPELQPLLDALNRLAHHHGLRLARTRRALGNLSHALKTPLAVMQQQADALRQRGDKQEATLLQEQLSAMRQTIERELQRARLAGAAQLGAHFDAQRELAALAEALGRLYPQVQITLAVQGDPCALDADDMLELFGNLLDNACKWADARVRVTVQQQEAALEAVIEDDGPGVKEQDYAQLAQAGWRADEQRPGHGIGLAIVQDIVAQYQGRLAFGRSAQLGGLQVSVTLPLAQGD